MVIVIGNGHGDPSSNYRVTCSHIKVWIQLFSPELWVYNIVNWSLMLIHNQCRRKKTLNSNLLNLV